MNPRQTLFTERDAETQAHALERSMDVPTHVDICGIGLARGDDLDTLPESSGGTAMGNLWTEIGGGASFVSTRLSLLARALRSDPKVRQEALDVLIRSCWKPLYAYVRAQGNSNEDAKDLVQGFCVYLLEKEYLARYDPALGRFRHFLLGYLRGYLRDQRDHARAKKRGGGRAALPIDEEALSLPAEASTGEAAFDRAWARGIIERAFERWKERLRTQGKTAWVPLVERVGKVGFGKLPPVEEVARGLGVTEAQVRHFLHRGKGVLREEILAEVRAGVGSDAEARQELQELKETLGALA